MQTRRVERALFAMHASLADLGFQNAWFLLVSLNANPKGVPKKDRHSFVKTQGDNRKMFAFDQHGKQEWSYLRANFWHHKGHSAALATSSWDCDLHSRSLIKTDGECFRTPWANSIDLP